LHEDHIAVGALSMKMKILIVAGDGIGPEVTQEAVQILRSVAEMGGHDFEITEKLIGGVAIKAANTPLPQITLDTALKSDAVLLGAVGGNEFNSLPPERRPEAGLLQLRRALGGFANLRPAISYPQLASNSPLRAEVVEGANILFVRELLGGLYFGEPRKWDKANVLEVSQLWRATVMEIAQEYPEITLEHQYVDACAMHLMNDPRNFDVVLTENLFGDILSDEAAVITGSLGMLPSGTIGGTVNLYEPVHGSAPDIAGKGLANPIGAILTAAMLLRHSAGLERDAQAIEKSVRNVIGQGYRTADLARSKPDGQMVLTTREMGRRIHESLNQIIERRQAVHAV
jgi:3-isopropylmalate dehydrogenase